MRYPPRPAQIRRARGASPASPSFETRWFVNASTSEKIVRSRPTQQVSDLPISHPHCSGDQSRDQQRGVERKASVGGGRESGDGYRRRCSESDRDGSTMCRIFFYLAVRDWGTKERLLYPDQRGKRKGVIFPHV
jgi:hypothetical protein